MTDMKKIRTTDLKKKNDYGCSCQAEALAGARDREVNSGVISPKSFISDLLPVFKVAFTSD